MIDNLGEYKNSICGTARSAMPVLGKNFGCGRTDRVVGDVLHNGYFLHIGFRFWEDELGFQKEVIMIRFKYDVYHLIDELSLKYSFARVYPFRLYQNQKRIISFVK